MSEDLSEAKSSVVKKLSLIEEFEIVRVNELLHEREHREKLIAIKEKEFQIQQEMKEQELQTHKLIKEINFDDLFNEALHGSKRRQRNSRINDWIKECLLEEIEQEQEMQNISVPTPR
ncbi:hypothetical protein PIB30_000532 [Stylosanthes scabra]|uniref:Uncharacterized protein n=1 Tax=Stylosanthes scabra TaxID=79078 RepID=A0ABU6W453_9FABA|nr:hypothetical protein [Stylosanthes scabra]